MEVHVVGEDPVRGGVVAALEDVGVDAVGASPDDLADARFAVASNLVGSDALDRANEAARAGATPWIAVEIGGVGGHPLPELDAAVSGFAPDAGCLDCLRARVESTLDGGTDREASEAASTDDATDDRPRADRSAVRLAGAIAGREAVRFLSDDEPSIVGRVVEVPHASRQFLPVQGCACGPDEERDRAVDLEAARDQSSLPLDEAVERAERAIDDRVGPITSIGETESHPVPYYLATSADTRAYSDARAARQAAGVDVDWNAALMKAVGEALERYCAGVYRDGDFVRARKVDLERPVAPTAFVRPDDAPAFDPTADYRWVPGTNLETGETVHLPADAVQFPRPGEGFVPAITTGLGLGSTLADAVASGLTEVIERDATMLAWYSTFDPIELAVDDEGYETLARRARSEELVATSLLVTQDVDVPVVAAAVHRDPDDFAPGNVALDGDGAVEGGADVDELRDDAWPAFAAGSAAELDPEAAARSALSEALQNWTELRAMGPEAAAEESGAIGEYASFPPAARSFVAAETAVPVASVGPDGIPTGVDAVDALVSRVVEAGLTPYAARLTTRDVERLGFEAVRVVVPGAQPLFTDRARFGDRAASVPATLGFDPRLEAPFHPYP